MPYLDKLVRLEPLVKDLVYYGMEAQPDGKYVRFEDLQPEMDEQRARQILGMRPEHMLDDAEQFIRWPCHGDADRVQLDGGYTVDELEAIVWWMRSHAVRK